MGITVRLYVLGLSKGIVGITGFRTSKQKTCTCSGGSRNPNEHTYSSSSDCLSIPQLFGASENTKTSSESSSQSEISKIII